MAKFATNKIITVTVTVYRLHSTFGDLFEDAGRQAVQVPGQPIVVVTDVDVPVVSYHLLLTALLLDEICLVNI